MCQLAWKKQLPSVRLLLTSMVITFTEPSMTLKLPPVSFFVQLVSDPADRVIVAKFGPGMPETIRMSAPSL